VEEAAEVLCAVHDLDRNDPYVVSEMAAINAVIELEGKDTATYTALFKKDILQTRYRVFLAYMGKNDSNKQHSLCCGR
jgi:poly(A) polymerase Pap1